jgi:catechol 2,3-dioxygenase-like lactoylglutathione lyase family enzyme
MFGAAKPFGSFAVDDLAAARKFYGETLGLRVSEEGGPLVLHLADGQRILIYPSPITRRRRSRSSTSRWTTSTRPLTS